ncbi:YoaK family protein [Streptomyces sp. SAJ15]|uniref:YoaK family protein n=1 Tax=Streptomyces sp. SAJ15 TaxID=2011095 RepID=UPI0021B16A4C|nr:YoaK family protein [Streptomyces sp. SAJ15]
MKARPGALTAVMVTLTATTGVIEAVSFLALGPAFTAMQSGNLLFLAFAITGAAELSAKASLASLIGFLVGAGLGARLESSVDVRGRRWFLVALFAEGALLAIAGLVGWRLERAHQPLSGWHHLTTALVAAAMGMRNVTALRAKVPDLPTTLATRSMAALVGGSPLALDHRIAPGLTNELRRAAGVGALFGGGLLGSWLLHEIGDPPAVLLGTAAAIVLVAAGFGLAPGRDRPAHD